MFPIKKEKKKKNHVTPHYHQLKNNESCCLCACFLLEVDIFSLLGGGDFLEVDIFSCNYQSLVQAIIDPKP